MESTHKYLKRFGMVLFAASCAFRQVAAQDDASVPRTNLQVFQELAARIGSAAGAAIADTDSTTLTISVLPKETGWFIEDAVARSLIRSRMRRIESPTAAFKAEFGINEMRVAYANIRQDGILGARVVDRTVSLGLVTKVVDQRSGTILKNATLREEGKDTVAFSDLDRLENPVLPQTKGSIPPVGFFSTFLEPIILLGTVAVAIVLLFTVRS